LARGKEKQVQSTTLRARVARRIPDPVYETADRHVFICAVQDVPGDLPKGANPRAQNVDRRIYRDVAQHLLNEEGTPNTFHLKNKGITILADQVRKLDPDGQFFELTFRTEEQGIVDGAHTYEIIRQNQQELVRGDNGENDIRQFVKIEVLTGLDAGLVTEIARGLNTAVQVQQMSLANLGHRFDWIKEELAGEPYADKIAFRENEGGMYDVRDVIVMLDLFNISAYPNGGSVYPVKAYSSKEAVLSNYMNKPEPIQRLRPVLKDILRLYDTISSEAVDIYNRGGNRRGGALKFVEGPRARGKYPFPFIGKEGDYRLFRGALFPMLGAFRWMVVEDPETGAVCWRHDFSKVVAAWHKTGLELMDATQSTSEELGRNPMAIGKSQNHWARLHDIVLKRAVMPEISDFQS
jgi:hypothetical protein